MININIRNNEKRLNLIFYQDYLLISSLEISLVLLLVYRNGILFNNSFFIHRLFYLLSLDYIYIMYLLFISKCNYTFYFYSFITYIIIYYLNINQIPLARFRSFQTGCILSIIVVIGIKCNQELYERINLTYVNCKEEYSMLY